MAVRKKAKLDVRSFQSSWRLCCESVVCHTSSIQRHFQIKHEKHFKDEVDKAESITRALARYGKAKQCLY